jgi:hypothetical protein
MSTAQKNGPETRKLRRLQTGFMMRTIRNQRRRVRATYTARKRTETCLGLLESGRPMTALPGTAP